MMQLFRSSIYYGNPYVLGNRDEPPTLYSLMESMVNFNNDDPVSIENLSDSTRSSIFNFDYPLDSTLKEEFELMFLDHYMFRRIGYETYRSWHIHLKVKLNDILPKYNELLLNIKNIKLDGKQITETKSIEESNSATSSIENSGTNDNRYSDTPENKITDIQNGDYVSDYTYNQTTGESSGETSGELERTETRSLIDVDKLDEYIKLQNKVNNIYSSIFKECDSLFYAII